MRKFRTLVVDGDSRARLHVIALLREESDFVIAIGHQLLDLTPKVQRSSQLRDRLVVRSSGRTYVLRTADIDWCEGAGNYVRLHVGEQTHLMRGTMGYLESNLDPEQFIRIHQSAIVNVDCIQELDSSASGPDVLLRDGTRVATSREYRDRLHRRLGDAPWNHIHPNNTRGHG